VKGPLVWSWRTFELPVPQAGCAGTARLALENRGSATWRPGRVKLSYHWLDEHGNAIVWDGLRNELPHEVEPGAEVELDARFRAPIPPGAYNSNTSDDTIIVSQPSTGGDWELWRATQTNGQWSACWGGGMNALTSSGVFPSPFGSSASGISYLATTITEDDVASGHINHAIPLQIKTCNGFTAPADRTDCGWHPGSPSEGTWFRMPASTPMPAGLTPFARMVFKALQQYGAVVLDRAGAVMIQGENSADWAFEGHTGTDPITTAFAGKPEYQVLNGIPWSHLQVILPPAASG